MTVEMLAGDCLEVLPTLAESSMDSCVTDPPYHLVSVYKRFANEARTEATVGKGAYGRHAKGFMGKQWDGGDIAFRPDVWREVYRVLKPGAHLLAFGGTRTYHRMACAIEDAGFEIRDTIMWVYGSGFPKSHDVSKGIDRAAGAERRIIGTGKSGKREAYNGQNAGRSQDFLAGDYDFTAPATDAARQWEGWGTALKPACEPIVLARKPLSESTVAANVLKWGTGAINVDGCRVATDAKLSRLNNARDNAQTYNGGSWKTGEFGSGDGKGRWPANLIHDGSEEVLAGFPESDHARGNTTPDRATSTHWGSGSREWVDVNGGDEGNAARFFYTAKADADDRLGSKHPTVKPLDLMQYLVRLVTPKGGLVLDPFAGAGTTGEAAFREGMSAILIEREAEYQADIKRRIAMLLGGPEERAREAIKERMKDKPRDDGPLFA